MWAKMLRALLRLCLLLCMLPAVAEAVEVSATAAVLLDADTGQVLYEKNGDEQMLIASTTKIMTALVVLEQAGVDDTVTVTRDHMAEGSSMYLKPGETVRVEELLYGRRICTSRSVTIGQRTMENHNRLLRQVEGCIGLKTGYTKAAGRTLVSCAERGGCRLIAVTLRDSDDWADHAALYEYGFCMTAPRMTAQQVAERMHRTVTEVWAAWIQWESGDA